MNRAVFFDRDDTIIRNIPYLGDPARVRLLPFAAEALRLIKSFSFDIFIVSNQSGVGRGLITEPQVEAVNREMERQLGESFFTGIYCCYDDPASPAEHCRKPSPAMIQRAASDFRVDLSRSFFVGDKLTDMLAGKNAGCRCVLIAPQESGTADREAAEKADFVARNLLEAARWILDNHLDSEK
jgi:D-glycero-D-manno-heptose 1,7-bisphosphate phosphatase